MKKAAGQCGLLWSIWHLARRPACIMYLALLLCQSHVNLCLVSIRSLDVRRAIFLACCAAFFCLFVLKFSTLAVFCRKVFLLRGVDKKMIYIFLFQILCQAL